MAIRRVHEIALRVVAERLGKRATYIMLETDESPRTEQRLTQV